MGWIRTVYHKGGGVGFINRKKVSRRCEAERGNNSLAKPQRAWAAHCHCPQHLPFPGEPCIPTLCHTPSNFSLWWAESYRMKSHPYSTASLWRLATALCRPPKCKQTWCLPLVGCRCSSPSAGGWGRAAPSSWVPAEETWSKAQGDIQPPGNSVKNKPLLLQGTEIWGVFVTIAEPKESWLMWITGG